MKAGLVTFYHIHHYGALLQAAATERAVERFGWDCEIIDYFVNQDNALFKRPTGLGSAAHDAHTALHYQALSERYRRFWEVSRGPLRGSGRRHGGFYGLAGGGAPHDLTPVSFITPSPPAGELVGSARWAELFQKKQERER